MTDMQFDDTTILRVEYLDIDTMRLRIIPWLAGTVGIPPEPTTPPGEGEAIVDETFPARNWPTFVSDLG